MKDKKKDSIKSKKIGGVLRTVFFVGLISAFMVLGALGGLTYKSIRDIPRFSPHDILSELNLNSYIFDESGTLIEKIGAEENRTIVPIEQVPLELQNALIAIEDERFWSHSGIDFRSIIGALSENMQSRSIARGASTITQQLARNVYLSNEVNLSRKIKEAYMAIKLENALSKQEVLEAYLNSIYFGHGAYGVQEASNVYFDKDVSELTLAESAVIAGITNSPSQLPPYILLEPDQVSPDEHILGEVKILGSSYSAVFNPKSLERQKVILSKMEELGYIDESQHREALSQDISSSTVLSSEPEEAAMSPHYFIDYVKEQVISDLVKKSGYTRDSAQRELITGGLSIYSTVDLSLQNQIEDIYSNFNSYISGDKLSTWHMDSSGNIVKSSGSSDIVYYIKANILDSEGNVFLTPEEYALDSDGNLIIRSSKLIANSNSIDIRDCYTIDSKENLSTHSLGTLSIPKDSYIYSDDSSVTLKSNFLSQSADFYSVNDDGSLLIDSSYFSNDEAGIIQPQAASVVIEQSTGNIKSIVGGRNSTDQKSANRALMPRQTGSSIKPLAAYLPALDSGFTAATPIDDVPFFNSQGEVWPNNYDSRYRGLTSLRKSVELSINTNAVKTVEQVGIKSSMKYLEKMGIIKDDMPDSFITAQENSEHNDENLAALGLGGFSIGISPLDMAGAYASIANEGIYLKPRSYLRVEDRDGNTLLDNTPSQTKVVSPESAFIMTDILRTTVSDGLGIAQAARIDDNNSKIPVAGKTGTTDENSDVWFVGYTPYYTGSVWIGNDSLSVKLNQSSLMASQLFSAIMKTAHNDLPDKTFRRPDNIVEKKVCTVSGKLIGPYCESDHRDVIKTELFTAGTEPHSKCDVHVSLKLGVFDFNKN